MGWSSHKLTYPFTKIAANGSGDLQRALQRSDLSQATLFANGTVNKWAYSKAFKYSGAITDRYNAARTSARDVALKAAMGGFDYVPIWKNTQIGKMADFWLNDRSSTTNQPTCGPAAKFWEYGRPTTYLRALDFENYIDNAEAPISTPANSVGTNNSVTLYCTLGAQSSDTFKYADLTYEGTAGGNMYFGYMMKNGSTVYYITRSVTISSEWGTTLTIAASSASVLLNKVWEIFPFLSNTAFTSLSTSMNQTGTFVALQDPIEMPIYANYANYTLSFGPGDASHVPNSRDVSYIFDVTNNGSSNLTNIVATITFLNSSEATVDTQTRSYTTLAGGATWTCNDFYRASTAAIAGTIKKVRVAITGMTQAFISVSKTQDVLELI